MLIVILAGLFWPLMAHGALFLTPPKNKWVRVGETNVTLVCVASEKIRACSWSTPYGKTYPLESGLQAESGRLTHFAQDKGNECGVIISDIQEMDKGRWRCNIGVVENSEVTTASGMANLSLAVAPEDVHLEAPFNQPEVNITEEFADATSTNMIPIKCVVENAKPAPTFNWTVDGVPIQGETRDEEIYVTVEGVSTFAQTLKLVPKQQYNNKTLICSIQHPGLIKPVQVETILRIDGTAWMESFNTANQDASTITLATVLPILAILTLAMFILRHRLFRLRTLVSGNGTKPTEKLQQAEEGENKGEEEKPVLENGKAEQVDATPEDAAEDNLENGAEKPEQWKPIKERITELLQKMRIQRGSENKKALDDTLAPEFEKVDTADLENPSGEGDGEEKQDDPEKQDGEEKQDGQEKNDKTQTPIRIRVRNLIERFQKKGAKADIEMAQDLAGKPEETVESKMAPEEEKKMAPEHKEEQNGGKTTIGSETPV